jgi:NAD(P)-dependent dehydrogenase (short-subunit alcohol dehydrogenase family)
MPTVLITGASKGIGRATALYLDSRGYTVFAGVRNPADGDDLCQSASARLQPVLLDITNEGQVAQAVEYIGRAVGERGLDALVNNAGMAVSAPLEFLPVAELRRQLEVNLIAQLAVTQAFLPLIREANGRIVNISSIGGKIAGRMLGAYHASKFALEALTDTLRQELAPWNIPVISIEPGAVATPIWDTSVQTADRLWSQMPPQAVSFYQTMIDHARAGAARAAKEGLPPEAVAAVVERALTERQPKTRYPVGRDAQIGVRVLAHLPDRVRDRLMQRF